MDWVKWFDEKTHQWFEKAIGQPTPVQEQGWPAIATGKNVLISAPTGTGKTLTAFLMLIDRFNALAQCGELEEKLYAIYISPLKALGNDIRENLKRPIEGLNAPLRVMVRNGDTPPSERQKMFKHPPHILITTPESLFLLLTSQSGRSLLRTARTVIIDEFHAVLSNKRGTHLLLSLTRLDALCGYPLQRIGLSATIRPLEMAADFLGGADTLIVAPHIEKETDVQVRAAAHDLRLLREHSIWPEICREIYEAAQRERTVLVFCEGRATAEKVAHGVNALGGEGFARTHHGSMDKQRRLEAEKALKSGQLKVLCATSSMELGIDVGEVDLVIQVGCPARISSALQRLGRAGHRPGEVSRMRFYPRMESEALYAAMTATAMRGGNIERAEPPINSLDILAQHLVSMAAAGDFTVSEALALLKECAPYRQLTEKDLTDVLKMLSGDDEHAADHPVSPRVEYDRIHGTIHGSHYSRLLALSSGGTIPDRGMYAVYLEDETTRLGELEEEFVFEARLGDKFLLGAFAWRIVRIHRDRVIVRAASSEGAQSPFWRGDGLARDYETGALFGSLLRSMEEAYYAGRLIPCLKAMTGDDSAAQNVARYIEEQLNINGCLATDRTLVMEYFQDPSGDHQMMLHCPYGGRVNQGLAILLRARAIEQLGVQDVRVYYDDDGVLLSAVGRNLPDGLVEDLDSDQVRTILHQELPTTAQFTIAFRYNMYRALMMGVRPGGRVPLWVQRMRGEEALALASSHPSHPILRETMRECMERYIDVSSLERLLRDIRCGTVRLVTRQAGLQPPSPMTLSLRRQVEAQMMYEYAPVPDAARRLSVTDDQETITVMPDEEQLARAHSGVQPPDSAEKLHEKLMIEGDLLFDETDAPFEWMNELAQVGRATYREPGLWIASEEKELYFQALEERDADAQTRIVRRCLRYRGPHRADELVARYDLCAEDMSRALATLTEQGIILFREGEYIHAQTYRKAQQLTLNSRRRAITTVDPSHYAAMLSHWYDQSGSPQERLLATLTRLQGLYLPIDQWEDVVLPAHTSAYRSAMLDEALSRGNAVWRLSKDGKKLAFFTVDSVDWESEVPPAPSLTEAEKSVWQLLKRRGASFFYSLSSALPGIPLRDVLQDMTRKGIVVCDSLSPLRKQTFSSVSARQRVRARVAATDGGRWELAFPLKKEDTRIRLERAFDRWGIVCRETAALEELPFSEALTILRQMEYTDQVRRGYFVRGLSGAQFVRCQDFARIQELLNHPEKQCVCLNAVDPAQAWGSVLKMERGVESAFLCVAGTVAVLRAGRVALIVERQGSVLKAPEGGEDACKALADAFRAGRIYPKLRLMTICQWPKEAAPWLEAAGFVREMRDYVLDRKLYGG